MTEKEKRDRGQLYDANANPELLEEMSLCKEKCFAYNALPISQAKERERLLRSLLGRMGVEVCIHSPFWCDYGYNIAVGNRLFINHNCVILDAAPVTCGDCVCIGPNCAFYTATHPLDVKRRNEGLEWAYPIHVGSNVWFGGGVTVLPGITIGDGTVVGAGSVVTHNLPDHVLAYGNPCKVVRRIEETESCNRTRSTKPQELD